MLIYKSRDLINNKILINDIVKTLKQGGVGIIPTDTVYGLAGICGDKRVKEKIYKIKKRPDSKSLVVQVSEASEITNIASHITDDAKGLIKKFVPGPITLIFKVSASFKKEYNWNIDTIGVRIPKHKLFLQILEEINIPLFVTSANISGEDISYDIDKIKEIFEDKVDFIIDEGIKKEIPSTIIDVSRDEIKIIREGLIPGEEIINK